jgi:hypothetical protein
MLCGGKKAGVAHLQLCVVLRKNIWGKEILLYLTVKVGYIFSRLLMIIILEIICRAESNWPFPWEFRKKNRSM